MLLILQAGSKLIRATTPLYVVQRMPKRARPEEEDRIAFSDALIVSSTTSMVDPLPLETTEGGGESAD